MDFKNILTAFLNFLISLDSNSIIFYKIISPWTKNPLEISKSEKLNR